MTKLFVILRTRVKMLIVQWNKRAVFNVAVASNLIFIFSFEERESFCRR